MLSIDCLYTVDYLRTHHGSNPFNMGKGDRKAFDHMTKHCNRCHEFWWLCCIKPVRDELEAFYAK